MAGQTRRKTVVEAHPFKPLRIAYFSEVYWPKASGVALTVQRTTKAMQARGHKTRVYAPWGELPPGSPDIEGVHRSPGLPLVWDASIHWAFPRRREVLADLAEFRPHIVHLVTEWPMGRTGAWAGRRLGVPMIASAHTDYERYSRIYKAPMTVKPGWAMLRRFYSQAAKVLCPSIPYERHLNSRGVVHTGIWARGVDPADFSPRFRTDEFRRTVGAGPDDLIVTHVGRLAPEKDLNVLADAWERLGRKGRRGAKLVIVGSGLVEDDIRARGLPDSHMTGLLLDQALSEAYASGDIFAFPSSTETFGNCLLEAMSSGLAPIVVGEGGVLDYARDGQNALIVPAHDPAAFAEALSKLLTDHKLRARIRQGALDTAAASGWDSVFDGLLADYRSVVEGWKVWQAA